MSAPKSTREQLLEEQLLEAIRDLSPGERALVLRHAEYLHARRRRSLLTVVTEGEPARQPECAHRWAPTSALEVDCCLDCGERRPSVHAGTARVRAGVAVMAALMTLAGCATCERHPVACTAAVAVIGASIALSVRHDSHRPPAAQPITCENDPAAFPNGCHAIM